MVTATLTATDPEALRSVTTRVVTAAVPLVAMGTAWALACLRMLPERPWRKRKGSDD